MTDSDRMTILHAFLIFIPSILIASLGVSLSLGDYKLIIYTHIDFQMLLQPAETTHSARRTPRKTKHITHHPASPPSTRTTHKRGRPPHPILHKIQSELHRHYRQLMGTSVHSHEQYLLTQMDKAFREQSEKLFLICKIKLKLEEHPPAPLTPPPSPAPLIESIQELPEGESPELPLMEAESFPWPEPGMHRAQSAKMLCDNYQNHQLVYSVETLTPKLAREDLEFKFIEELQ